MSQISPCASRRPIGLLMDKFHAARARFFPAPSAVLRALFMHGARFACARNTPRFFPRVVKTEDRCAVFALGSKSVKCGDKVEGNRGRKHFSRMYHVLTVGNARQSKVTSAKKCGFSIGGSPSRSSGRFQHSIRAASRRPASVVY